ncbi:MAG: serine hydrolase [Bacteroidota bacterium]
MKLYFLAIPVLIALHLSFLSDVSAQSKDILETLLKNETGVIKKVIAEPEKYRLQILYTQIDRNKKNKPRFTSYRFGIDSSNYFYPASSVKLAAAVLAMHKLNSLNIPGLDKYTPLRIDSAFAGQTRVLTDTTSEDNLPSIAQYIKKILLVSDNDAYNRLYEFLGQSYLNTELHKRGYRSVNLMHRLSSFLTREQNAHTNPFTFYHDSKVIYSQPAQYNPVPYQNENIKGLLQGTGYISGDSLVNMPKDFTYSNRFAIEDLQSLIKTIFFPESVIRKNRFNLKKDDYSFLYKYMSMLPRESVHPYYDTSEYYDSYVKFFIYGDSKERIPGNIRIYNKVGDAYGYMIDNAYVVDQEKGVEFLLTAVIYVNEDGIFNDDKYEYDTIGTPFMAELGRMIYGYELSRKKM